MSLPLGVVGNGTRTTGAGASWRVQVAWVGAGATVLAEIAYPLVSGHPRDVLTIATVLLFCGTVLLDAGPGWWWRLLLVAGGFGYAVEVLGVHTGFPFGNYRYSSTLGTRLGGVPLVIPLAWTMMSWPALCVGRRLARTLPGTALAGGVALASWDLFLDPQMVHAGHWVWSGPGPRLNGIPVVNHLGWLVAAVLLIAVLHLIVAPRAELALPIALWLWTFASSVLANAAFFGRPGVALAGGLGMGLVGVPLIVQLRAGRA